MEWAAWLLLTGAALVAGMLNAVAGGGSFLTLPALIVVGLPPVAANATGTAALLPGYISGAWTDRAKFRQGSRLPVLALVLLGTLGGAAGAVLLLATSDQAFRGLIPWLLLFATLLFAFGPRIQSFLTVARAQAHAQAHEQAQKKAEEQADQAQGQAREQAHAQAHEQGDAQSREHAHAQSAANRGWGARVGIVAVCGYGGYFNGGMGIIMLALFRLLGEEDIRVANALKNLLSAILTGIAVVIYAWGGIIYWPQLLPMAVAAFVGGWAGVAVARHVPAQWLRHFVVVVGLLMTLLFFWHG